MNDKSLGQHYLADALQTFRDYKKLAERAFAQISDEDFFKTLDEESNSIAVNMKHMAGNMISRWTDFLTTDGEKPERDRDIEFVMLRGTSKDEMVGYWEKVGSASSTRSSLCSQTISCARLRFAGRMTPWCRRSTGSWRTMLITRVRS